MLKQFITYCLSLLLFTLSLSSVEWVHQKSEEDLMRDLMICEYWDTRINDKLPVTFNHLLQGGYFNMPSARMGEEGEIGAGYSYLPPYRIYSLRCQLTDRVEFSGNYRIFHGVDDPHLSALGFGDMSDKGANFKFSIFSPEDSGYTLPGLAFGFEDFMGTKNFYAYYVVLTHVFKDLNFEASLGYGGHRIRGFFGGLSWFPFHNCGHFLDTLSFSAEYDATPYKDPTIEKHPKGRKTRSPINWGLKYRLWDHFDFSVAYVRGREVAASGSVFYNFGETEGFVPKVDACLPYKAPMNIEPLGPLRTEEMMVQDLFFAFSDQGFDMLEAWTSCDPCGQKVLRIKVENLFYRLECNVRERIMNIVAYLVPSNIDKVIVTIDTFGVAIQEYHFIMEFVRKYTFGEICAYELAVLTPLREASYTDLSESNLIMTRKRNLWNLEILPRTHTLFGSSKGKFKYALGINAGINGYIFNDVYYSILLGCNIFSDLGKLTGVDRLNPSQLINVRTDVIRYYRYNGLTIDKAFLQKNWNMGCGIYSRVSAGYFEIDYGGAAAQILYYPVDSCWAVGIEGAILKKRTVGGLGFTNKIRKLNGFVPTYKKFLGSQYFASVYYDWHEFKFDFQVKAGKFLANDYGVRFDVARYFPSGLRVYFWYTVTNGRDRINGHRYYDKGIGFEMPMDIFYTHADRDQWGYGMSAWLRDVGVSAETGVDLYEMIREQRNYQ